MQERVARPEQAITEAVKLASPALQRVIYDLQALRGIADVSAVTCPRPNSGRWTLARAKKKLTQPMPSSHLVLLGRFAGARTRSRKASEPSSGTHTAVRSPDR